MILKIGVVGAGGHGRTVAEAVSQSTPGSAIVFLDDDLTLQGAMLDGVPVAGSTETWLEHNLDWLVLAVGDNARRQDLAWNLERAGGQLRSVTHPRATISGLSSVGVGTVVLAGAIINPGAHVGRSSIVNSGAIVEHDCNVGDFVHLAPGSCLGGNSILQAGVFVGLGARILPGVRIGAWATVGAGAVVTKDVEDGAVVVGVPARRLR